MQQEYDLPDEQRREELTDLLDGLKRARDHLPGPDEASAVDVSDHADRARAEIGEAILEVENELDELPEWDADIIRRLVTGHAYRSDAVVRTVDSDVMIDFEVGPYGEETNCRYEVAVATGDEWFFVRQDGDWVEVWRS